MLRNLKNDTEAGTAATYTMTLKATCVLCMLYYWLVTETGLLTCNVPLQMKAFVFLWPV